MNIQARLRREDGAAAVEFALIAGVLAMLIFGMLQYGLAFFQLQNLRAASREGARIGAVGASVTQIKQRVADASLGALPPNSASVNVYYTSDGTNWGAPLTSGNGCPPKGDQEVNSQVKVAVDLKSGSLPPTLQNIFVVDIPLMPPIDLTGATINGVFRCEGN
jgi:Flp pilus assembly protein TadG